MSTGIRSDIPAEVLQVIADKFSQTLLVLIAYDAVDDTLQTLSWGNDLVVNGGVRASEVALAWQAALNQFLSVAILQSDWHVQYRQAEVARLNKSLQEASASVASWERKYKDAVEMLQEQRQELRRRLEEQGA
jgi:hypothetical protein